MAPRHCSSQLVVSISRKVASTFLDDVHSWQKRGKKDERLSLLYISGTVQFNEAMKTDVWLTGRIPELDGLRGLAISMVLLYHYIQLSWVTRPGSFAGKLQHAMGLGWTGVDLFFVLSGFLIGGILLDARSATNYFEVFYTRRFFRIVPLYAIVVLGFPSLISVLTATTHGDFTWFGRNTLPWYSYWAFAQNFWMAHTEQFGTLTLAVTWSLAVEEQFYLTLPFVVRWLDNQQLMKFVRMGIYTAPLLRIGLALVYPHNWVAPFVLMPCRADALLLGVLAAMLLRDISWRERFQRNHSFSILIPVLSLGMIALAIWAFTSYHPIMQSLGYTWVALFYTNILAYSLIRPSSVLRRVLRAKWLGWLGGRAYGVYLLHELILGVLFGLIWHCEPTITGGYTLLTTLAALALTLVIADFSWRYFEYPLVRRHRPVYELAEQTVAPANKSLSLLQVE